MKPLTALEKTLTNITETDAIRLVGPATFSLGKLSAEKGDVTFYQYNAENTEITAKVKGGGLTYTCWISQPGNTVRELDLRCACTTGTYCKHVMAALWHIQTKTHPREITWRDQLETFLSKNTGGEPLALVIDTTSNPPELSIRRLGPNNTWVAKRASWTDMTSTKWASVTDGIRSDHLNYIRKIWHQASLSTSWVKNRSVTLLNLEHHCWSLLHQAQAIGILLFLDNTNTPLQLANDEIELKLDSYTNSNQDIELKVVGQYQGEIINNPQIVEAQPALVKNNHQLIPITPQSNGLIETARQRQIIRIPAEDLQEYTTDYLPYLTNILTVKQTLHGPYVKIKTTLTNDQITLTWKVIYENNQHQMQLNWEQALQARPTDTPIFNAIQQYFSEHTPLTWGLHPTLEQTHLNLEHLNELLILKTNSETALENLTWEIDETLKNLKITTQPIEISLKPAPTLDIEKPDWFNLEVSIQVNDETITVEEILKAITHNRYWVTTTSGTWTEINPNQLNHLKALLESASSNNWETNQISIPRIRLGMLSELEQYDINIAALENWINELDNLLNETPQRPLATPQTTTLRPYQETGSAWLDTVTNHGYGAILADDMGLGKTLQILTTIETKRQNKQLTNACLVIAPTSVIDIWEKEANRFYPQLKTTTIKESHKKRQKTLQQLQRENHLLITSWNLLQIDQAEYLTLKLDGIIFDEAQALKNPHTKQHKAAKNLQSHWKIASTGTPIENSLNDLWAIMRVINPGLLPTHTEFTQQYGKKLPTNPQAHKYLQALLQPFMKRRTKKQVAAQLPPKIEQTIYVDLAPKHRRTYNRHLNQHRKELLSLTTSNKPQGIQILIGLNQLRQLALDPTLIETNQPTERTEHSAKTKTLLELIQPLAAQGKKSLVFSQYTSYLQKIRQALTEHNIETTYLDGSTRKRSEVIETFKNTNTPVFLISLKAGGTGLTLTEAENVFILDPWWNPATENQAIDRAHRIGQQNPVNVYRICAKDTIEEKVLQLQEHKRQLAESIIGENQHPLTLAELKEILN